MDFMKCVYKCINPRSKGTARWPLLCACLSSSHWDMMLGLLSLFVSLIPPCLCGHSVCTLMPSVLCVSALCCSLWSVQRDVGDSLFWNTTHVVGDGGSDSKQVLTDSSSYWDKRTKAFKALCVLVPWGWKYDFILNCWTSRAVEHCVICVRIKQHCLRADWRTSRFAARSSVNIFPLWFEQWAPQQNSS